MITLSLQPVYHRRNRNTLPISRRTKDLRNRRLLNTPLFKLIMPRVLGYLDKIKITNQDTMDLLKETLKISQETSQRHTKIIAIHGQDLLLTQCQTPLILSRIANYYQICCKIGHFAIKC